MTDTDLRLHLPVPSEVKTMKEIEFLQKTTKVADPKSVLVQVML